MTAWFRLRLHLLLSLLGGLTVLWVGTLLWTYNDTHTEIDEIFDAQLAQAARQALEQYVHGGGMAAGGGADHDDGKDRGELLPASRIAHPYQQNIAFQIWDGAGRLLLRSPSAPAAPMASADGYSDGGAGGWRFFGETSANGTLRVLVGQRHAIRDELIGKIAMRLALPLLLGLPLSALWIGLALRRGMAPLSDVAAAIAARGPEQLDAVAPARAPEEIRPLVESLNGLLGRLSQALDAERRFTADAAHELRTPLAGLRAQAQVALRAADEPTRRHALEQLLAGSGRAARLIDQLLTLARLDPTRRSADTVPLDFAAVTAEVCADLGPAALSRNIALSLDAAPSAAVRIACSAEGLRILVRNLVDNAVRYTPIGGAVRVGVAVDAGLATLTVADSGPGIPAAQRALVFERFRRLSGQDIEGSGLGLSIVARIAELAGAAIELDDGEAGRGLKLTVRFPATSAT